MLTMNQRRGVLRIVDFCCEVLRAGDADTNTIYPHRVWKRFFSITTLNYMCYFVHTWFGTMIPCHYYCVSSLSLFTQFSIRGFKRTHTLTFPTTLRWLVGVSVSILSIQWVFSDMCLPMNSEESSSFFLYNTMCQFLQKWVS